MNIVSYGAITIIAYLVGLITYESPLDNKWIPSIVGAIGLILGIVGFFVVPEFPAANLLDAAAVGVLSGLAATGADQVVRQQRENK